MFVFEWDKSKDEYNLAKHGVGFNQAREAFFDENKVIADDVTHSTDEPRYYCFGQVNGRVMTVRLLDGKTAFALSAPDIGEKERQYMRQHSDNNGYTDEPLGPIRVRDNFLPPVSVLRNAPVIIHDQSLLDTLLQDDYGDLQIAADKIGVSPESLAAGIIHDYLAGKLMRRDR